MQAPRTAPAETTRRADAGTNDAKNADALAAAPRAEALAQGRLDECALRQRAAAADNARRRIRLIRRWSRGAARAPLPQALRRRRANRRPRQIRKRGGSADGRPAVDDGGSPRLRCRSSLHCWRTGLATRPAAALLSRSMRAAAGRAGQRRCRQRRGRRWLAADRDRSTRQPQAALALARTERAVSRSADARFERQATGSAGSPTLISCATARPPAIVRVEGQDGVFFVPQAGPAPWFAPGLPRGRRWRACAATASLAPSGR